MSTCTHEENDNEKRLPREEKLAYELKQKASGLAGLGWAGPELAGLGACARLGACAPGLARLGSSLAWFRRWSGFTAGLGQLLVGVTDSGLAKGKKREKKERSGGREKEE